MTPRIASERPGADEPGRVQRRRTEVAGSAAGRWGRALAVGLLAGALTLAGAQAQEKGEPPAASAGKRQAHPRSRKSAEASAAWRSRSSLYYQRNWGIDVVGVRPVSSGLMLRFDYRVVDPDKAAVLTDHRTRPYLIDEATRTALSVPAMEKVGELRQMAPLEPNRTYFMIFGNPGRLVKPGSRVTVVAGNLRVEGLVVDDHKGGGTR